MRPCSARSTDPAALNEYISMDFEMGFIDASDIMNMGRASSNIS
ncbi:MAG: hypothetical protein ACLRSW_09150 [Christensenellaceae bacterium]